MRDEDLERLLQTYEPAAPPPSLRAHVLHARPDAKRGWPWAVAAAALLAATVWMQGASVSALQMLDRSVEQPPRVEVAVLTDLLGGGDQARETAERIVAWDDALEGSDQPVGTAGGGQR